MPRLSVYFVRASLLHLGLGITFGSLMLANKGVPFAPDLWRLLPAHMETLLIGWFVGFTMGVAFWIMPRFAPSERIDGAKRFGDVRFGWAAFILLNSGVILASVGQVAGVPAFNFAGRISQALAVLAFIRLIYARIKPLVFAPSGKASES